MGYTLKTLALGAMLALGVLVVAAAPAAREANACGSFGPYDFDTYEYPNSGLGYGDLITYSALGRLPQLNYELASGDHVDLRYQGLETGARAARTIPSTANVIPPSILKSIVWNESGWANGAPPGGPSVPWGGIGAVIRSFDCGYGLGQVTSGMGNNTGTPSGRQAAIGTHPVMNMMEAIRILADKWNSAPSFRPIAGQGNPADLEDWYYAIWSYNGFAFSNHPLNPDRDPMRGALYHCYSPLAPESLTSTYNRGHYTYPELVYGCMVYPPTKSSAPLWQPQTVSMPAVYPSSEIFEVSAAFAPEVYSACEDASFSGGCPGMDYPTTIPEHEIWTHTDNTPDPGIPSGILGAPILSISGPPSAELVANANGSSSSFTVTVRNTGTSLAPYRIRSSAPWLVARHPDDAATRTLDGGIAAGADVPVSSGGTVKQGYDSILNVTVNVPAYPGGDRTATLWIEPLYGGGSVYQVQVNVEFIGGPLPFRIVVPGATR